jgi:hypothetical protein
MNFDIYCDESRQEYFATPSSGPQERFVLIGGLWIITEQREYLKAQIGDLRARHSVHGEFKWTRVSPSRLPFYLDLVNLFFDSDAMRFRCLVLPANQLDAIRFHHGDNELMFYKFYYQLLHNWILDFNTYQVFTDLRTNRVKQRLERLRQILDSSNYFAEVASVQALPSEQLDLLQLADVLIGAVGYRFHHGNASPAKLAVSQEIETRLGRPIQPTRKVEEKFNIFRWRPGGGW